MRLRWPQAALLAGVVAAGLVMGAPGVGGQSSDANATRAHLSAPLAQAATDSLRPEEHIPGELIVKFRPGVARAHLEQGVVDALRAEGAVDVLVLMDDSAIVARGKELQRLAGVDQDTPSIRSEKKLLYATQRTRVIRVTASSEVEILATYSNFSVVFLRVKSEQALLALVRHPEVVSVSRPRQFTLTLSESLPLINQPAVEASGHTGAGTSVAVLDTGVDYTRAAFGVCTAPGTPASCKVAYAADFAPDDGQLDDNGHGTNVAGIVVGVAPDTQILALDVFTGGAAWEQDIKAALDWIVDNADTYNIVAANLSLGNKSYNTAQCPADPLASPFNSLRSAGVLPVSSSGNHAYSGGVFHDGIGSPACVPGAISVGSVWDSNEGSATRDPGGQNECTDATTAPDQVSCFSNSASFLSLLAPGAYITAAGLTYWGTSQAAPHVSGAVAVLWGKNPAASASGVEWVLTGSGPLIVDARPDPDRTTRRLDLHAAADAINSEPAMITVDDPGDDPGDTDSRDDVLTLREAMKLATGILAVGTLDSGECDQVSNSTYGPPCSTTDSIGAASADTIDFDTGEFNPGTITLGSSLPTLGTGGDTVDGSAAGVIVDGDDKSFDCFKIQSSNNTIGDIQIRGCAKGIKITGPSTDNLVARNVISGNQSGVYMSGASTSGNVVIGNRIGTNADGTGAWPNGEDGIVIANGASNNTIGGSTEGQRNVISGNVWSAVWIRDAGTTGNNVIGNYIGTDGTGTIAVPNAWGVYVSGGADDNEIGGSLSGEGNLISGNTSTEAWLLLAGVTIEGAGTTGNRVIGNKIGTNAAGTDSVVGAPDGEGVIIAYGASNNIIGGSTEGERNIISGNGWSGVWIRDANTSGNKVIGNYIGTDASGVLGVPNEWGVYVGEWDGLGDGAQNNVIGGTGEHEGNIIAFNRSDGVTVSGSSTTGNSIRRNSIHSNVEKGIKLVGSGNDGLAAPVIDSASSVSGHTDPKCYPCTVEIFSDGDDEGRIYHDSVPTNDDATGTWVYPGAVTGPNVTATVTTDPDGHTPGNTSEFSEPSPWSPPVSISLTDGFIEFDVVALGDTVDSSGDVQTVEVKTGPANLLIKTTLFSDGLGNTWTLDDTTNGPDQVVWEFSKDGSNWEPFTLPDPERFDFDVTGTGVPQGQTRDIYFQLTMPTETSSSNKHSATVTVVAVTP